MSLGRILIKVADRAGLLLALHAAPSSPVEMQQAQGPGWLPLAARGLSSVTMILYAAILTISLLTACEGRSKAETEALAPRDTPAEQASPRVRTNSSSSQHLSEYPGGSYALLIGVSEYKDKGWPILPGVGKQISDLEKVLRYQHSFKIIQTEPNMTFVEAKTAIDQLLNDTNKYERGATRVLIFLSGHGHSLTHRQRNTARTYFVLADTPSPSNANTGAAGGFMKKALAFEDLVSSIDQTRYKNPFPSHVLLVLDSCQAGNIFNLNVERKKTLDANSRKPVIAALTAGSPGEDVSNDGFFTKTLITALLETPRAEGILTAARLGHILNIKSDGRSHTPLFGELPNDSFTHRGQFIFWPPVEKLKSPHDLGS